MEVQHRARLGETTLEAILRAKLLTRFRSLGAAFLAMDRSGTATLSADDFARGVQLYAPGLAATHAEIEAMVGKYDADADGRVTYSEFAAALSSALPAYYTPTPRTPRAPAAVALAGAQARAQMLGGGSSADGGVGASAAGGALVAGTPQLAPSNPADAPPPPPPHGSEPQQPPQLPPAPPPAPGAAETASQPPPAGVPSQTPRTAPAGKPAGGLAQPLGGVGGGVSFLPHGAMPVGGTGPTSTLLPLRLLSHRLSVCRFPAGSALPAWATSAPFFCLAQAGSELSVVCPEGAVPREGLPHAFRAEHGWRPLRVGESPLQLDLVGVLAAVCAALAKARVPVFVVSTFDTDYVLVRAHLVDAAVRALREAGHAVNVDAFGL